MSPLPDTLAQITAAEVWVPMVAAGLGALGAGLPAWITLRRYPSRTSLDAVSLVDAAETAVKILHAELVRKDAELEAMRSTLADKAAHIRALEAALIAAGLDPGVLP